MTASCQIFQADRLDCRLVEHRLELSGAEERRIEELWRERKKRKPGAIRRTRPSRSAGRRRRRRLRATNASGRVFRGALSRLLAWKQFGQPDWGVFNCFSAPALRSSDGAFVAGEMAQDHSQPGRIYFPCGTPDREDVVGDRVDLTGCLIRELAEETGIEIDESDLAPVWRIVSYKKQRACLRVVNLRVTLRPRSRRCCAISARRLSRSSRGCAYSGGAPSSPSRICPNS